MTKIGDTYAGRFLIWLAASAAILGITFVLLVWWMEQFSDRSDFHTNGRMWVVLTIEMIDLIPVPAFLLIVFCVAVPRWLAHEYRRGDGAPRIFPLVFTVALIEFALLAPLFWGSSERIWLIGVGPIVAVTAASTALYVWHVIRRNQRAGWSSDGQSGGATGAKV